jgi:hypothetical protein
MVKDVVIGLVNLGKKLVSGTIEFFNNSKSINDLTENEKDTLNILYDYNNKYDKDNKPWEFHSYDNLVGVIVKTGFSNFIIFGDEEMKNDFINDFVIFMFKHFEEQSIFSSRFFRLLLNLNFKKTIKPILGDK